MRKLNDKQKQEIIKDYGRIGFIIILNTEKYGKENNPLEKDIDEAREIMYEQAQ
jgi:hypothetical protein